ncbi:MAG: ATP synthase F0 subunit B, partial [Sandaracinaceae bacterium]|nr:ATP synthase F0 subunit B [Sandaracinaceae bacterium]
MSFDLPTFVLQAVNFLVLALVLWRLLWRPLRKHMRERAERIAQGLDTLEQERAYLGQL